MFRKASSIFGCFTFLLGSYWAIVDIISGEYWGGASYFFAGLGAASFLIFWQDFSKEEIFVRYFISTLCGFASVQAVIWEHPALDSCMISARNEISLLALDISFSASVENNDFMINVVEKCGVQHYAEIQDATFSFFKALYFKPELSILERLIKKPSPPKDFCIENYSKIRNYILRNRPNLEEKYICLKKMYKSY